MISDMSGKERKGLRLQAGLTLPQVASMVNPPRSSVLVESWEVRDTYRLLQTYAKDLCIIYKHRPYIAVIDYTIAQYRDEGVTHLNQLHASAIDYSEGKLKITRRMIRWWLEHWLDATLPNDTKIVMEVFSENKGKKITTNHISEVTGLDRWQIHSALGYYLAKGIIVNQKYPGTAIKDYWLV